MLEHASFDEIGLDAFSADALSELGQIAEPGGADDIVTADVSSAIIADGIERDVTQYRLRFEDATDGDGFSDTLISAWTRRRSTCPTSPLKKRRKPAGARQAAASKPHPYHQ